MDNKTEVMQEEKIATQENENSKQDSKSVQSLIELFTTLKTSTDGLTQEEAEKRIKQYGYNELREEKINPVLKFLSYFWGPIAWMIEVAMILSILVKHYTDFIIILALLLMNGIVGFWEEYQAGNAIEALKAKLALRARVKRNNEWKSTEARELVPGDIIRLRMGDIIPADARLLEGDEIEVDQSALTGESLPVTHKTGEVVYSGSIVKQGEIEAVVFTTGANTYFGKTAHLVQTTHTTSHFQKAVLKIGDYLIVLALTLVILILIVALFRDEDILTTLQFALILTVAAVPVAMPAVLSVTMAVGAKVLAKKNAIVSRLASIEELAGMNVLCSDKTGTLTKNQLTLGEPFCVEGIKGEDVILSASLASRAENNDPIDLAVLSGLKDKSFKENYDVLHFQPFDPIHKRTEALVKNKSGKTFKTTKGAVQVIMDISENIKQVKEQVDKAVNEFASRGFRSLGVARTDENDHWKFLGVIPLYDPPRDDSKETIHTARDMGINVKMVTGDRIEIAKEIARELDLGTNLLDANIFNDVEHHKTGQLNDDIENDDGFAQVFPEHKYHIVDVLQKRGHIVGMTGDGVNDAPALKKADAGIAVSGATDAARLAADIVLLTPGLSVIIDAIKESRKIFQRMNSYAIYRIAETIRVLFFMTLSILVFNFYPVTAVMIVLLALLNDGPILSIAYDNTVYSNEPEKWNMPVVLGISTVLGILGVIASFGLFYIAERLFHLDRNAIQTFMFLKLAVAGHLTIFVTRTRKRFWSIKPAPILLWSTIGTKLLATIATVYGIFMTPIGWYWSLLVWGYALVWFVINDQVKVSVYKVFDQRLGLLKLKNRKS
jgi:H+-transporting ATPase